MIIKSELKWNPHTPIPVSNSCWSSWQFTIDHPDFWPIVYETPQMLHLVWDLNITICGQSEHVAQSTLLTCVTSVQRDWCYIFKNNPRGLSSFFFFSLCVHVCTCACMQGLQSHVQKVPRKTILKECFPRHESYCLFSIPFMVWSEQMKYMR